MAFGDRFKTTVLTEYKADTADHEKAIKSLSKAEKRRVDDLVKDQERAGASLEDLVVKYGKVAAGVGAVAVAVHGAREAFSEYQKRAQLTAATVGLSMDGLQKATSGLVEETRLLQFAATAMNGTFQLSQKEMETAVAGAVALSRQGKDLTDTLERVEQAVREGNIEPLKELGLVIKGAESDTEEGLQAAIAALGEEAKKLGPDFRGAGEEAQKAGVAMSDSWSRAKANIGEVVAAMGPLLTALARLVELATDLEDSPIFGASAFGFTGANTAAAVNEAFENANRTGAQLRRFLSEQGQQFVDSVLPGTRTVNGIPVPSSSPSAAVTRTRSGGVLQFGTEADESRRRLTFQGVAADVRTRQLGEEQRALGASLRAELGSVQAYSQSDLDQIVRNIDLLEAQRLAAIEAAALTRQGNILSQLFGTPAEIEATAMALQALGGVTNGFVGAFGQGVDALITGSSSFSEAFKNAIAESARSLAVEFSMQALRHSLFGLGALAFGDPRAAIHFKAAAGFAAGGVALGVTASSLGAGQGAGASTPLGTSGVGSASPGGGSVGNGNRSTVYLLDDSFTDRPAGEREAIWRAKARRAGVTFEGDAVING